LRVYRDPVTDVQQWHLVELVDLHRRRRYNQ
jgi:hypothetical protein